MQVVLLLELLLDVDTILPQTLGQLDSFFRLASCNAEVRNFHFIWEYLYSTLLQIFSECKARTKQNLHVV